MLNIVYRLDDGWAARVVPIPTYQPFSKKWIRCALLELTDTEFNRIVQCDTHHHEWPVDEMRNLTAITGRPEPVRKAISAFVSVKAVDVVEYINGFSEITDSGNRMADAKAYRKVATWLRCFRLSTREESHHPLRGFNAVIFEKHLSTINRIVSTK